MMKHFTFMLVMLVFLSFNLKGQTEEFKTIFREDFSDNKRKWKLYDEQDFLVKIDSGKLHIQKFEINRIKNGCLWYNKKIHKYNTSKNFSIIFYSRVFSFGDIFDGIDFQWGNLSEGVGIDSLYQVDICPQGIRLSYFKTTEGWTYFDWSYTTLPDSGTWLDKGIPFSSIFKLDKFNKYEIAQKGNWVSIKVNNALVYKKKIKVIGGHSIGIQQCLKSSWEIDKIVIKQ